ncbi:hypothetical protein [Nocardia takedensis]|uniref:hypothetical protein n=1 Tax=Nocardia takedensis TaxID=259390 RepID=UPI0012F69D97|nr:hypothetical protein [Nocardia takedensis]
MEIDIGWLWMERLLDRCEAIRARSHALPSWLRQTRDHLSPGDQNARWQRIIDMVVVAGDGRVADLAD